MAEAKHSFVDDNPYLVYSPNAEMTYNGNSGGGGGDGASFLVVGIDSETGALQEITGGEMLSQMKNNGPVLALSDAEYYLFLSANIDSGTGRYFFHGLGVDSTKVITVKYMSLTENGKVGPAE